MKYVLINWVSISIISDKSAFTRFHLRTINHIFNQGRIQMCVYITYRLEYIYIYIFMDLCKWNCVDMYILTQINISKLTLPNTQPNSHRLHIQKQYYVLANPSNIILRSRGSRRQMSWQSMNIMEFNLPANSIYHCALLAITIICCVVVARRTRSSAEMSLTQNINFIYTVPPALIIREEV